MKDPENPSLILRMAWVFERVQAPDSISAYAKMLSTYAYKKKDTFSIWNTYLEGATLKRMFPDSARSIFESAYHEFKKTSSVLGVMKSLASIANMESDLGQYESSNSRYEDILKLVNDQLKDYPDNTFWMRMKAVCLNNYSINFSRQKDLLKASSLLLESKEISEQLGFEHLVMNSAVNLGIINLELKNLDKAKKDFKEGIALAQKMKNKRSEGYCVQNLGVAFSLEAEYDSAIICFEKALGIAQESKNFMSIYKSLSNLGSLRLKTGDYEEALKYSNDALELASQIKAQPKMMISHLNLSSIYAKLQQFSKAEEEALTAIKIAKEINDLETMYKAQKVLSDLAEAKGDYRSAMTYFKNSWEIKDSLFQKEKIQKIEELQTKYETARKEREIARLSQQSEIQELKLQQQNFIIIALLLILGLLALQAFFFYRQKILKEKHKTLEAKQKLLRSQMNPHFFFNALSSIQSYLWEKEQQKGQGAARYLGKFSKLMRMVMESSSEEYVPLDQEIETLENYLSLQQYRYKDRFRYEISCEDGLEEEDLGLPPMLAQPFIENAIQHGFKGLDHSQGEIKVLFARQNGHVRLTIEDNGIGRSIALTEKETAPKSTQHRSLATSITRERLQLLKKAFRQEIKMDILDLTDPQGHPKGTRVQFDLPLIHFNDVA